MQDIYLYELEKIESNLGRIEHSLINEWRKVEAEGKQIIVSSYKNISYVVGLLKGVGGLNPIIIAENGGIVQIGIENPPLFFKILLPTNEEKNEIEDIKGNIQQQFKNVWFMQNEVILGIYINNLQEANKLQKYIDKIEKKSKNTYTRKMQDFVCVIPKSISLQRALELLNETDR